MKNLSKFALLAFLSLPALSFADCLQNICTGEMVLNSSSSVGRVESIDRDKNVIIYTINGSKYSTSPASLTPKIISERFPEGKLVINSANNVGKTLAAFADGRVLYTMNSSNYVSSTLEPEIVEHNQIKAGTIVINSSNSVGEAQSVFADGRILYSLNGSLYVSKTLTREVEENNGLRIGLTVINSTNSVGQVRRVFEDGRVLYAMNGSQYVSSTLVKEIEEAGGIRKGTLVMNSSNSVGVATTIFADGRILYKMNNSSYVSSSLVKEIPEINGIKAGVTVMNSSNSVGVALNVFSDGRVLYNLNGSQYVSSSLTKEVPKYSDFEKDVIVVNSSNKLENVRLHSNTGLLSFPVTSSVNISVQGLSLNEILEKNKAIKRKSAKSNNVTRIQTIIKSISDTGFYKFNTFFSYYDGLFNKRVYGDGTTQKDSILKIILKALKMQEPL
jgi:hypothetical protein